MRILIRLVFFSAMAITCATAQQAQPSPNAGPQTDLPAASGAPEPQGAPELLPESLTLPAPPPELRLPAPIDLLNPEATPRTPSTVEISAEERAKAQPRLLELRSVAERTPRAMYLLKLANGALTDEAKREFMRAYHHTVCLEMRRLDPRIRQVISDYERTQIRNLAQGPSRLVAVPRKSQRSARPRTKSTDR
jgi:hypothetical protein